MSSFSPDSYARAWHFATRFHANQTYGGATEGEQIPYLNHIGSVAMEVLWALSATPELDGDLAVQCALLHDTLEDTAATYDLVLAEFGPAVAAGVAALTKDKTLADKAAQMQDSLDRIRQQPQEVWMVKMADRITNLRHPPYYWTPEKMQSYRREAQMIYASLHPAHGLLAERLLAKIEAYNRFWEGR